MKWAVTQRLSVIDKESYQSSKLAPGKRLYYIVFSYNV